MGKVWTLGRQVEDLFKLQVETREAIKLINDRLRTLEDRVLKVETAQPHLISEAKTAAGAAASLLTGTALSDMVTRLTRLESRIEQADRLRLSSLEDRIKLEQGDRLHLPPPAPKG